MTTSPWLCHLIIELMIIHMSKIYSREWQRDVLSLMSRMGVFNDNPIKDSNYSENE